MRKNFAGFVTAALAAMSLSAFAETDYVAMPIIRDIQKGVDNKNQIEDLRVKDTVTIGGAMTVADSDGAATFTVKGYEASDASLILDADEGDDNADTWTLKSEATGNDLSVLNHTTEVLNLTSAGALSVDSTVSGTGFLIGAAVGITTNITFYGLAGSNVTINISGGIVTNLTAVNP